MIGTTPLVYIPPQQPMPPIQVGGDYFLVRIVACQAAWHGRVWERARHIVVTSEINLNHPVLGTDPIHAIQHTRPIQRSQTTQLGIGTKLTGLIPATMTEISISIKYLVDHENRVAQIAHTINDHSFVASVTLSPAASAVAKSVSTISKKLITSFLPVQGQDQILTFAGGFDLPGATLRPGYYAALGSTDDRYPLPSSMEHLSVDSEGLKLQGRDIANLSYVLLRVVAVPARSRALHEGAPWNEKLEQVEAIAFGVSLDSGTDTRRQASAWNRCREALMEAKVLINADPNYLPSERTSIIVEAAEKARVKIFGEEGSLTETVQSATAGEIPTPAGDYEILGVSNAQEVASILRNYRQLQVRSGRILAQLGENA